MFKKWNESIMEEIPLVVWFCHVLFNFFSKNNQLLKIVSQQSQNRKLGLADSFGYMNKLSDLVDIRILFKHQIYFNIDYILNIGRGFSLILFLSFSGYDKWKQVAQCIWSETK